MEKLESKIDKLLEVVHEQSARLDVYNSQLGEHMRRTELLEKRVSPIEIQFLSFTAIIAASKWVIGTGICGYIFSFILRK